MNFLTDVDTNALSSRWWMLLVRGFAAIAFGIVALVSPGISLLALVLLWGAYALTDGVFSLSLAYRTGRAGGRWGWLLFEGLLGILAAAAAVFWPGITALVFLGVIAFWAIFTGIAEIIAAVELRRAIRGEWLLAVAGVLSVAFGVLMFAYPSAGALAVLAVIGVYSILFGALLVGLGFRVHHLTRTTTTEGPAIGGPTPTHA
jgi:uncharacterized membrane protein HdeD (DUF308 family)